MKPLNALILAVVLHSTSAFAVEETPEYSCYLNDLTGIQDGPMIDIYNFGSDKAKFVMYSPGGPSARLKTVFESEHRYVSNRGHGGLADNNTRFETVITRNDDETTNGVDEDDYWKLGSKMTIQYFPITHPTTDGLLVIRASTKDGDDINIIGECNKEEKQ